MADMETLVKEQINVVANLIKAGGPGVDQKVANFLFDLEGNLPMLREDRGEVERFLIDCFVDLDLVWKYTKSAEHGSAMVDPPGGTRAGRPLQVQLQAVADRTLGSVLSPRGSPEEWVEAYVGRCFTEFVRGITRFEEDGSEVAKGMTSYVEQLLYDHLRVHAHADKENFGHRFALADTERRVFRSSNRNYPAAATMASTGVHFGDHAIPLVLRISYLYGRVATNEVYTRTRVGATYAPEVACIRTEHNPATGVIRNTRWTQNFHDKTSRRVESTASVTDGGHEGSGDADTAETTLYPDDAALKLPCKHFNTCSHTSTGQNHGTGFF